MIAAPEEANARCQHSTINNTLRHESLPLFLRKFTLSTWVEEGLLVFNNIKL